MPAEMKRAGHLTAQQKGTKGKRILLLGHLDTVLTGEKFRREGGIGYGTGIADMKSGNVILYYALKSYSRYRRAQRRERHCFTHGRRRKIRAIRLKSVAAI